MRAPTPSPRLPFWLIGLLAASLLGLATIVYYFLKPLDGPVPNDAGIAYSALEQGKTSEGFPRLGRADAPIIVEEFSSYACSHCRAFHEGRLPDLLDNIAAGQVQYILIPMGHIGSGADNAVRAAFCAGEQDRFWAMHDVLFSWQKKFLTRTFDPKRINKGAANLGLDLAVFDECVDAARTRSQIDLGLQIFRERGLSGTPSFFINGRQIVDYAEFDELDSAPDLPGGGES